jgi:membrane-bound lytic murein transglycosylase C
MKQDTYSKTSDLNYASIVKEQANRFGINSALVFALIETESHFNPYATSAIPAYGLMQVVPRSAGRDAWKFLHKSKGQPTKNYLFNPRNNIEMGSAYMHILQQRYLVKVKNPKNRELCAIAAYNTGSGNVLRSFHRKRSVAFSKINALTPDALYNHLRKKLPYKETRDYIKKVTLAKKRYL